MSEIKDKKVTHFCINNLSTSEKNSSRNQFSTLVYRRKSEKEGIAKTNFQPIIFIFNCWNITQYFILKLKYLTNI